MAPTADKKGVAALASALESNRHTARATLLLLVIALCLVGLAEYIFRRLDSLPHLRVDFTREGATIWAAPDEKLRADFFLPGSSLWTDTGISVPPGEKIRVTASGSVHLAVHNLIRAARKDEKPDFGWIDPNGVIALAPRPGDRQRQPFRIVPDANIGALLGYLRPPGVPPPSIENPRPEGVFTIGADATLKNESGQGARLWLILNDVLLDPKRLEESRAAYVGPEDEANHEKYEKMWNRVLREDYFHLWFDDNIGYFLVQVEQL